MSKTSRYFVDPIASDRPVELGGAEAHHLLHVMRCQVGDQVVLFDGRGNEYPAQVTAVAKRSVTLLPGRGDSVDRELPVAITLGVAFPKGDRQRVLVEKAVELGVARLVPIQTSRSVVKLGASAIDKLRRAAIEASKQCGRNLLLDLADPLAWEPFLEHASVPRWIADPLGSGGLPLLSSPLPSALCVAIGPEGGFSSAERAQARAAGWESVSLGPRILRVETAAIAVASWFALQTSARAGNAAPTSPESSDA